VRIRSFFIFCSVLGLVSCAPAKSDGDVPETKAKEFVDLSKRKKPVAITTKPWQEVVVTVSDFENISPFFLKIAGFETVEKSASDWVLRARGSDAGDVRLKKIKMDAKPARPAISRSWDKGCYFSLMMRANNLPSIIEDARGLGWTPLTEMAYLEFGLSKLHIVVLTHESGMRVQLYERLNRPIPGGFTPFERVSRPFNIMQMVEDRDASFEFFQQKLGFDTHYYGPPYVSEKEEVMPIGIPPELTTKIPYFTAIMTPKTGLIYGRMEMIDVDGMPDGSNYSDRCNYEHTGIIAVRFKVDDLEAVRQDLGARKLDFKQVSENTLSIKTPDGANIEFYRE